MLDDFKRLLPEEPTRWRLGFAGVLVLVAITSGLIGVAAQSQAAMVEAVDLLACSLLMTLDGPVNRMSGLRRIVAGLARYGLVIVLAGAVGISIIYRCFVQVVPAPDAMATVAALSLATHGAIFGLIPADEKDTMLRGTRRRVRSELIGGAALLVAAGVVAMTQSPAADLVVAMVGVALLLNTHLLPLIENARNLRTVLRLANTRDGAPR